MDFQDAISRIRSVASNLDDDDPDKAEMLNVEGDYSGLMEWALRKRTEAVAMADANDDLAATYKVRSLRFSKKADSMKDIIGYIMEAAQEKTYNGVAGTVNVRTNPPKPIIIDESAIPDDYKKTTVSIDNALVNYAMKNGYDVPGVSMDNGSVSIVIRTK